MWPLGKKPENSVEAQWKSDVLTELTDGLEISRIQSRIKVVHAFPARAERELSTHQMETIQELDKQIYEKRLV